MTVASPSLSLWQRPPNPVHKVFVAAGPYSGVPVLLKTANETLTTSTKWFGPTAPFVSGGAYWTVKVPAGPTNPCPMPSKDVVVAGAVLATADCTAVSAAAPITWGKPRSGFSFLGVAGSVLSDWGGIDASGGEMSCLLGVRTVVPTWSLSSATAMLGTASVSASRQAKTAANQRMTVPLLDERATKATRDKVRGYAKGRALSAQKR